MTIGDVGANDLLTRKLESREAENQTRLIIQSLIEDTKELDTRLKNAEKHITPDSIQKWGEVQWRLEQVENDFARHEIVHPGESRVR